MLDNSPNQLLDKQSRFGVDLWQLQTPLSRRQIIKPYGLDNGCFAEFKENIWRRQLKAAEENRPVFVCSPDIVGDAARTLDLFEVFSPQLNGLPKALVLQDGIGSQRIPWREIDAVFVGGSDAFKISSECLNCLKVAQMLGKWIHIGRVNTPDRLANFLDIADSIDGSGISKYDHMLEAVIKMLTFSSDQMQLAI